MKKKIHIIYIIGVVVAAFVCGCSHSTIGSQSTIGRLVGGDRDDHGCLSTAGYTWSDALHDCVRVWEVGDRFDDGPRSIYVIYSTDSMYAEIFTAESEPILCKRKKGETDWKALEGKERIYTNNGVTTVKVNNYNYTKKAE